MKRYFLSLLAIAFIGTVSSYGQSQEDAQVNKNLGKKELKKNLNGNNEANSTLDKKTQVVTPPIQVNSETGREKNIQVAEKQYYAEKPATKSSGNKKITSIEYQVNSQDSDLSTLLNLVEIKQKVNETSPELKDSQAYSTLENDIIEYKAKFNKEVETKQLKNCSKIEQSYYLAFLKEDGKMDEYATAVQEIK